MKTRRQFIVQTLRGIACLSPIAFLGMKVPEVVYRRPGTRFIAEAKDGWHYMWSGDVLYGCHPDHAPEKTYQVSDSRWITEPVQFWDPEEQVGGWHELDMKDADDWSLGPGPTLYYTGQMPLKGQIAHFTAPTRGQG